jgi:hypothetical protein
MHQQSLDHSYSKRETSLTKLKTSQSVMILVVRLDQLTEKSKYQFPYQSSKTAEANIPSQTKSHGTATLFPN